MRSSTERVRHRDEDALRGKRGGHVRCNDPRSVASRGRIAWNAIWRRAPRGPASDAWVTTSIRQRRLKIDEATFGTRSSDANHLGSSSHRPAGGCLRRGRPYSSSHEPCRSITVRIGSDRPADLRRDAACGVRCRIRDSISRDDRAHGAGVSSRRPAADLPRWGHVAAISDRGRGRSKPGVSPDSVKYEPVLRIGTDIQILRGPESASGYWWYRVHLEDGLKLRGGIDSGWLAAADDDGDPWIGEPGLDDRPGVTAHPERP